MAIGDIGTVIRTYEFDTTKASNPGIVRVKGDIYAVVYDRDTAGGFIKTVRITDAGIMIDTGFARFQFEAGICRYPRIVKMADGIFAVAYEGPDSDGWLKTIGITDAGYITETRLDEKEFDAGNCREQSAVKVTDEVIAIAYRDTNDDGKLVTLGISGTGAISSKASAIFDAATAYKTHIIHIAGEIYAIAYQDFVGDGWVKTIQVGSDGTILDVAVATLEFESDLANWPRIARAIGEIYAIVYYDNYDDGWISTVQITDTGAIVGGRKDYFEFDEFVGWDPDLIALGDGVIAVPYQTGNDWGEVISLIISATGTITKTGIRRYHFNETDSKTPRIFLMAGNVHAIAYAGPDADGFIITLPIERAEIDIGHELLMGIL